MLLIAAGLGRAATTAARTLQSRVPFQNHYLLFPSALRFYGTSVSNVDPVALQMINYALAHARTQKSDESYAQGLLVLEQCLSSNLREGSDNSSENAGGMVLLAMSSLLSERGSINEAIEKLEKVQDLTHSYLGIRVAALEGLIGLHLEMGQDDTSSVLADKCLQLLQRNGPENGDRDESGVLETRAKAVKGLVQLVLGNIESAEPYFSGFQEDKGCSGNVALPYGELLHATGNFPLAKQFYEKAIQGVSEIDGPFALEASNMQSEEVLIGATCALGQLEAHVGNFANAEEILTRALTKAEQHFGSHHPKVGVILTSIALMFRKKAKMEHSSSILIQEGLYRRAIDLLKAPPIETEDAEVKVDRRDITALARGGYAETLCVQQNRKGEGEKMKKWAETTWKNSRLSLAEALELCDHSSKVPVIDARISRVL